MEREPDVLWNRSCKAEGFVTDGLSSKTNMQKIEC